MSSVSHANKIREYIALSIYYQCSEQGGGAVGGQGRLQGVKL